MLWNVGTKIASGHALLLSGFGEGFGATRRTIIREALLASNSVVIAITISPVAVTTGSIAIIVATFVQVSFNRRSTTANAECCKSLFTEGFATTPRR